MIICCRVTLPRSPSLQSLHQSILCVLLSRLLFYCPLLPFPIDSSSSSSCPTPCLTDPSSIPPLVSPPCPPFAPHPVPPPPISVCSSALALYSAATGFTVESRPCDRNPTWPCISDGSAVRDSPVNMGVHPSSTREKVSVKLHFT